MCQELKKKVSQTRKGVVLDCSETPHAVDVHKTHFSKLCQLFSDNDATSKIDDVLTEYGGLLHVLPSWFGAQGFGAWA